MGLIARFIEEAGVPTVSMTSALDITRKVKPPRALFLNFPLGHQAGKPFEPELQREIAKRALLALEEMKEPGEILMLPYEWLEGGDRSWEEKERERILRLGWRASC